MRLNARETVPVVVIGGFGGYEWHHSWVGIAAGVCGFAALVVAVRSIDTPRTRRIAPSLRALSLGVMVGAFFYVTNGMGSAIAIFTCVWAGTWLGLIVARRRRKKLGEG